MIVVPKDHLSEAIIDATRFVGRAVDLCPKSLCLPNLETTPFFAVDKSVAISIMSTPPETLSEDIPQNDVGKLRTFISILRK